jgi:catechol 2,3-dioxygenase-like lactoylglutathione lyase family enzyme
VDPEIKIESNVKQAVSFFAVTDIQHSLDFYVAGLGFEITHKWIDEGILRWCWLQSGGAAVMLQQFKKEGHDSWVPEGKVGIGVSIYFICEDALAIYEQAKSKHLAVKTPFVGNHMWVTELSDPDGYKVFFESPTNAPEDSVYFN